MMLVVIKGRSGGYMGAGIESLYRVLYHGLMHSCAHTKPPDDDTPTGSRTRVPVLPSVWIGMARQDPPAAEVEAPGRVSGDECSDLD